MTKIAKLICPTCAQPVDVQAFDLDLSATWAYTQIDRLKEILGERCQQAINEGRPSHQIVHPPKPGPELIQDPDHRTAVVEITRIRLKPDEFLIARAPENWSAMQTNELAEVLDQVARQMRENLDPRCMVLEHTLVLPWLDLATVAVPDPALLDVKDGRKPWPRRDPMG